MLRISLKQRQGDGSAELCFGVETLRDAKIAFRAGAALCLLDGRSLDRFDFHLLNQPADIEFGLTGIPGWQCSWIESLRALASGGR